MRAHLPALLHSPPSTRQIVEKAVDDAMLAGALSQLARSGNGLEHAYVRLDLKSKELTDIAAVAKCVHLRVIDLSGNLLTDVSAANTIPELCSLNISGNKLTASNMEPRPFLQVADFSGNQIADVSAGFAHPMLQKLNLSENKLTSLEGLNGTQLPKITELRITANMFTAVGSINLPTLTHLFLDGNQLESLDGIGALTSLQTFSARKNQIKTLDGFSEEQKVLSSVDLGENSITVLAEASKLQVLTGLESLALAENAIADDGEYRSEVLISISNLVKLDDEPFEEEERVEAATQREKRKADALAAAAEGDGEEGGEE